MPVQDRATDSLTTSIEACCQLAKRSKTQFYLTFFSLPRPMFRDMCVLYAFMRITDDLADDLNYPVEERARMLTDWRQQLADALGGQPVESVYLPAVAELVHRQGIDPQWLVDVIDGVESDLTPRVFQTFAELDDYCYHVAGAVGLSCIQIWKYDNPQAQKAAIACGTAFQLTNILRDIVEDLETGRVYLPQEDLDRFGVSREQLRTGGSDPAYQQFMAFQVQRAREFYAQARPILNWLSPRGRRIQRSMFAMYGGLLDEIERRGFDVQTRRVRVPRWKKLKIAAGNFWPF